MAHPRETKGEGQRRTGPDTEGDPQTRRATLASVQADKYNASAQESWPPKKEQRPEGSCDDP